VRDIVCCAFCVVYLQSTVSTHLYSHLASVLVSCYHVSYFQIRQTRKDGTIRTGRLNLVDLAGSENVGKSHASGDVLKEAQKINKSLSALGNVIYALTEKKFNHIPYRDSKLTHLLRDSLGGNTKTLLIITCSPHQINWAETLSTLKFAKRAKNIRNAPHINKEESASQLKAVVAYLEEQLEESEAQRREMQMILDMLGITRDADGNWRIPKDLRGRVEVRSDGKLSAMREAHLLRKIDRLERKIMRLEENRLEQEEYYDQLKELFEKQRRLAEGLSTRLQQRDDTISMLDEEITDYNKFHGVLADAAAGVMRLKPNEEVMERYIAEQSATLGSVPVIEHVEDQNSTAVIIPVQPPRDARDALTGIDWVAQAEDGSALPPNEDEDDDNDRKQTQVTLAQSITKTTNISSNSHLVHDGGRMTLSRACRVLEAGAVFMMYPSKGFFAKPQKRQLFYDRKNNKLYHWEVGKKLDASSKFLEVDALRELYVGKLTDALQKKAAKKAPDDCCFAVKDATGAGLDMQADSYATRDTWVTALYVLTTAHHLMHLKKKDTIEYKASRKNNGRGPEPEKLETFGTLPEMAVLSVMPKARSDNADAEIHPNKPPSVDKIRVPSYIFQEPERREVHGPRSRAELMSEISRASQDADNIRRRTADLRNDPLGLRSSNSHVNEAADVSYEKHRPFQAFAGRSARRDSQTSTTSSIEISGDAARRQAELEAKMEAEMARDRDSARRIMNAERARRESNAKAASIEDGDDDDESSSNFAEEQLATPIKVKALYSFQAKSKLQLSFKKGDIIQVTAKKKDGWWDAKLGDKSGAIPYNYVQEV
jgi:Kinesin motor domain/SH3 domain